MNQKRWLLSILLAVLAVLATDYFFIHFIFPSKREAILFDLKENVERELRENPIVPLPAHPPEPKMDSAPSSEAP